MPPSNIREISNKGQAHYLTNGSLTAFDMGVFPVVLQENTDIFVEEAAEDRVYNTTVDPNTGAKHFEKKGRALVTRWKLSRPALGFYTISAWCESIWDIFKCIDGDEEKIRYQFFRHDSDPDSKLLGKLFRTVLSFDRIEFLLFPGDDYPRLALLSGNMDNQWVTWQQTTDEEGCRGRDGYFAGEVNDEFDDNWCRFWKLEKIVDAQLRNYLATHPALAAEYERIGKENDPHKKMELMQKITAALIMTPFPVKDRCRGADCWTKSGIEYMAWDASRALNFMHQFYTSRKSAR